MYNSRSDQLFCRMFCSWTYQYSRKVASRLDGVVTTLVTGVGVRTLFSGCVGVVGFSADE